jgi:hypothetical protein
MLALLIFFLFIDTMACLYVYRQAFVVRSNMNRKYKNRFMVMMVVIGVSLALAPFQLSMACLVAGLPAVLLILFGLAMAIAVTRHKGPWS